MSTLQLGVIGNCVVGSLIDTRGRHVFCGYPRLDGDPIFNSLINRDSEAVAGFFDLDVARFAKSQQSYLGNSAILVTTITDEAGASLRITDFAPRFKQYGRTYRPAMLMRKIEPLNGTCLVRIRLRPRMGYGSLTPTRVLGSNHVSYVSPDLTLRLTTDAPIAYVAEETLFALQGPINLILGPDETVPNSSANYLRDFLESTQTYWDDWSRYLSVPFEWQEAVIRAAVTLKLCSFEETGAVVAALTTSIPEAPNSGRTWDYRYCWPRDAYFVVHALNRLGATRSMEEYLGFITNITALEPEGCLKPVYPIVHGTSLEEHIVDSLAGYRGMGPVRVGNAAVKQVQHDAYGSVIMAAAQMFFDQRLPRPGGIDLFHVLEKLGHQAARLGLEPDASLWEYRGRARVHTHSSVMCWAACSRLARIALRLGLQDRADYWIGEARRLREAILNNAWNEQEQSFVDSFGGKDLDASMLLLHEVGFISASDPRFLSTLAAVERHLRRGKQLLRYAAEDDFGLPETAFTVCTFWYIDALSAVDRRDEAREMFEHVLTCRNHLGLLSEDVDSSTGELWGNFPQTYSMVGLIVSAMRLSKSWEEAFWRNNS
jgi:GH15 family glucan-1,4-alpha-glucosidase